MRSLVVALCVGLSVSGCVTTPSLENVAGVKPKSIVDVIECELIRARNRREARRVVNPQIRSLCDYVAVADLSLQVDEQLALAPSFTHTDVVSKTLTRAFDWGLKFDTQSQRTHTQSVTFIIKELEDKTGRCNHPANGISLNGNLGIEETIDMGFAAIDPRRNIVASAEAGDDPAPPNKPLPPAYSNCPKARPSKLRLYKAAPKAKKDGDALFSTHIEFVLLASVNSTGPTFTLANFKGPGKLLTAQRTHTHGVTIGFAKPKKPNQEELSGALGAAAYQNQLARESATRNAIRLLQRLP